MAELESQSLRNPFHNPLVTELIEDPELYQEIFSDSILVGQAVEVFQPTNVVLVGSQGTGKTMILNLLRYGVISEWLQRTGTLPGPLRQVTPYFGISVNLTRADFHAFGRRSLAKAYGREDPDHALDAAAAADYLNHFLFREFLHGLQFLFTPRGNLLASWLGLDADQEVLPYLVEQIRDADCWNGYYRRCRTLPSLLHRCDSRLKSWRQFLNTSLDVVPDSIWRTKTSPEEPLHVLGNLLTDRSWSTKRSPLFVAIDQYEVLPELNPTHGTSLQRVVNTFIKLRDPVVFFKLGARTHDWGRELRIWGSESRVEFQRDYVLVNLNRLLAREEYGAQRWLFRDFALDVARRRFIHVYGRDAVARMRLSSLFEGLTPESESWQYFRDRSRVAIVLGEIPASLVDDVRRACGADAPPLDLRLAAAFSLQRLRQGSSGQALLAELETMPRPWTRHTWRSERVEAGLLQVASMANQRKLYCGWSTVLSIAGANISAFLLVCREIWDTACKWGLEDIPVNGFPLQVQSEGIWRASDKWRERDRDERLGGRKRFEVLGRLGPALSGAVLADPALSNPGWFGFSLKEAELAADTEVSNLVAQFLENGAGWAIFEEKAHTSRMRGREARRKWYLHPLLCPVFGLPLRRVKEPFNVSVADVYAWLVSNEAPRFDRFTRRRPAYRQGQQPLPLRLGD